MKSSSIILAVFVVFHASAQDSVRTRLVSPGVIYSHHQLAGPFSLDVLQIDLTNPAVRLESYRPNGLVPVSRQFPHTDAHGTDVLGAVNGDFFSFKTFQPVGNQVVNGVFVNGVQSKRSHLGISGTTRPFIMRLSFSGKAFIGHSTILIHAVNQPRPAGEAVLYNHYWGSVTPGDFAGVKAVLRLLSPGWGVADTVVMLVNALPTDSSVEIPHDGAVLVVDYLAVANDGKFARGDTVKLLLGFEGSSVRFTQVIGGAGRILENGATMESEDSVMEGLKRAFLETRHPRTFLGLNKDTTQLYICTVDGRQQSSIGMNFSEMAGFLKRIGAWNGINLDGGGSTTMTVEGTVINSPSDSTGERAVANSLRILRVMKPEN